MNPLVTIIMATYNRAHLIPETLVSIQNQTYPHWECLIVDDGSTDNTKEIVEQFCIKDSRFLYRLKDTTKYKKGLSGTRNFGLDWAEERKADYIQLFDDDDIMHPQKLELQIKPLLEKSDISFTICQYKHFKPFIDLKFDLVDVGMDCNISSQNLLKDFYHYKILINSLGPLWRASTLLAFRFDEELLYGEERDLYLKIFLNSNIKFSPINYVLFYYRKHEYSNTKNRYNAFVKNYSEQKIMENWFRFADETNQLNIFLLSKYLLHVIIKQNQCKKGYEILKQHKSKFNIIHYFNLLILIKFLDIYLRILKKAF
ncbi:MAG: glycosyltransferase family 2 protein [Flavobacteriales bacterium]|nr:glycosyltransferase family 2 protein [Flavobacteriales bacterium]